MGGRPLQAAVAALADGGLVAYPTEGVWGLGCDPANPLAVDRLLAAKSRDVSKGLILIAHDFEALRPWVRIPPEDKLAAAMQSWPGPSTWLFPAADDAPGWITGDSDRIAAVTLASALRAGRSRCFGGHHRPASGLVRWRLRHHGSLCARAFAQRTSLARTSHHRAGGRYLRAAAGIRGRSRFLAQSRHQA